ncbi:hypothetical protein quinque_008778 [Culex quinquefasciatus]
MKVNPSKCKSIIFTRSPAPIRYDYTFDRHEMDRVCSIRDLGLLIDRKLSFSEHVSSTTAKAFALLGFLRLSNEEETAGNEKSQVKDGTERGRDPTTHASGNAPDPDVHEQRREYLINGPIH